MRNSGRNCEHGNEGKNSTQIFTDYFISFALFKPNSCYSRDSWAIFFLVSNDKSGLKLKSVIFIPIKVVSLMLIGVKTPYFLFLEGV